MARAERLRPHRGTLADHLATLTFAAAVEHVRRSAHDDGDRPRPADAVDDAGHAAWKALSELPRAQRDAIALAHLSGSTYAEIVARVACGDDDRTRNANAGLSDVRQAITSRAPFERRTASWERRDLTD